MSTELDAAIESEVNTRVQELIAKYPDLAIKIQKELDDFPTDKTLEKYIDRIVPDTSTSLLKDVLKAQYKFDPLPDTSMEEYLRRVMNLWLGLSSLKLVGTQVITQSQTPIFNLVPTEQGIQFNNLSDNLPNHFISKNAEFDAKEIADAIDSWIIDSIIDDLPRIPSTDDFPSKLEEAINLIGVNTKRGKANTIVLANEMYYAYQHIIDSLDLTVIIREWNKNELLENKDLVLLAYIGNKSVDAGVIFAPYNLISCMNNKWYSRFNLFKNPNWKSYYQLLSLD